MSDPRNGRAASPRLTRGEFSEMLRHLRNQAAESGDMETAYRHERRLQILLGVPASFTARQEVTLG